MGIQNVLVVDDSPIARKMLVNSLPKLDWSITNASNGEEALTLIRENSFDLVFLDLTMPVMDGVDVLSQLQSEGVSVNIIVVSADIQQKMQDKIKALGAMTMLQKPIKKDSLLDLLASKGLS